MTLDKQIAEQIKRMERLQKDLIKRRVDVDDAKRPEEMKKERAAALRDAIATLQKQKRETIARYDAEIKAREAELKTLQKRTDVELVGQQSGGARVKRQTKKKRRPSATKK
ncbi:hypothetical protein [Aliiroseovarius sp. YM-037]|uniref:hypothetical protein n=1 Tax=Aliiroseovarius sp. YM-037 TaxID=3341728 RepID=UPI003A7FD521